MKLLLTAFGPFDGRAQNASALALKGLKERYGWLNTRVLPVDGLRAPQRMIQALRQLKPNAVIMLGEARGATTVRLETTAWNELNFTLPDVAGWQPRGGAIVAGAPRSLAATLPMEIFQADLSAAGFPVACSTEPGRYLCNQLMFCTLSHLAKHSPSTAAGFIHLPLSSELETSRAIDAIGLVIQGILTRSRSVDFPVGTRPPRR